MRIDQPKDSVARDMEALLNTRLAVPVETFADYPEAKPSILHDGLVEFAGYCLSSTRG